MSGLVGNSRRHVLSCRGSYIFAGKNKKCTKRIWALSSENVSSDIFDRVNFKPACSATEAI